MLRNIMLITIVLSLCVGKVAFAEETQTKLEPKIQVIAQETDQFSSIQKNVNFGAEGYFYVRRIDYKDSKDYYETAFWMPGKAGWLHYFDANKKLVTTALKDGELPLGSILYLETEAYNMVLGQGYNYKDMGYGTKQSIESDIKPISIKKVNDQWLITYTYKKTIGNHGILWGVGSQKKLLDYSNPEQLKLWSNYDLCSMARFAEDGYYYKSPNSYQPTDTNAFWRIPSMFIVNSFVKTGVSLADHLLGNAMLIIAADNVNEQGFLPSLPQSNWLKKDYNIGAGYFDTRFNADTGLVYLVAYQKFVQPLYRDIYLKISDYTIQHILGQHYTVLSATGEEGWLVEDYAFKDSENNHVALNHQLQTIYWFLLLYEQEQDEKYMEYALLMLQGIKNTRDRWIMEDGNLEYAYMPDGTMGLVDYPYLAYNDLYNVQGILQRLLGKKDEDLDVLMTSKKMWMDAKGITEYFK